MRLSSFSAVTGTTSPSESIACAAVGNGSPQPVTDVSDGLHRLTDEQRESAIKRAGALIEHYMAKYEATSDLQYRGDADRALRMMEILIAGRSDEAVKNIPRSQING